MIERVFDTRRLAPGSLPRADWSWPALLRPDRTYEVCGVPHRTSAEPDELGRRRAVEVDLLERGAVYLEGARSAERELR
jgi:hypothetical protein